MTDDVVNEQILFPSVDCNCRSVLLICVVENLKQLNRIMKY